MEKMKFMDTKPATLYVNLNGMKGSVLTITEAVIKALATSHRLRRAYESIFKGAMILTLAGIIVKVIGAFSKGSYCTDFWVVKELGYI